MIRRFSSRSFTGIRLWEVAVGTERLACIFSTILSAEPLIGVASIFDSLSLTLGLGFVSGAGIGFVAARAGALAALLPSEPGLGAAPLSSLCGGVVIARPGAVSEVRWSLSNSEKYARHDSSTSEGSLRNRANKPSTYVAFAPKFSAMISEKSIMLSCWGPRNPASISLNCI